MRAGALFFESATITHMAGKCYEEVLDRAVRKTLETAPQIMENRSTAPDRLDEILSLPASERDSALAKIPPYLTYPLASHALERSERVISCDLDLALALIRISRTVTARINPRTCGGSESVADMGAYALAMEGNVHRVRGDMAVSLAAFGRSRELQKLGGVDPHLLALIDLMEASLRRDLGQLELALALLDHATEAFLALGERQRWLHARINRANVFLVAEEFDEAALILESLGKISSPQEALCIGHNLATALVWAGRAREAEQELEKTRALSLRHSNPLIKNRRLWIEGIIAERLGQDERAGHLLLEASTDLEERGYAFDAALARIDLSRVKAQRRGEPLYTC